MKLFRRSLSNELKPDSHQDPSYHAKNLVLWRNILRARRESYRQQAINNLRPIQGQLLDLYREVKYKYRQATEKDYPGQLLRKLIVKESISLQLEVSLLPYYLALIPFYSFKETGKLGSEYPLKDFEPNYLGGFLVALFPSKVIVGQASRKHAAPILVDWLNIYWFEWIVFKLCDSPSDRANKQVITALGLDTKKYEQVAPFGYDWAVRLPPIDQYIHAFGFLGDPSAIPVIRAASSVCPIDEYTFVVVLSKLGCKPERAKLQKILQSGEIDDKLIMALRLSNYYEKQVVERISKRLSGIKEYAAKRNCELFLQDYDLFLQDSQK